MMVLKPANSEWVLRATTTSPISLKEYQLNLPGIQFDWNDTFGPQVCVLKVDYSEQINSELTIFKKITNC
jgi:hypothetical protein